MYYFMLYTSILYHGMPLIYHVYVTLCRIYKEEIDIEMLIMAT